MIGEALEFGTPKPDYHFVALVKNKAVLWAINSKLMERGLHLARESEIGCALLVKNDHPKLIHDTGFAHFLERRTGEPVGNHMRIVCRQKLCDSGNSVTYDVVQQLAGKPRDPMLLVSTQ